MDTQPSALSAPSAPARKPRAAPERQFVPTAPLVSFMERHNMKAIELSKVLHLGPSTVGSYVSKGKMPAILLLALEALDRRSRSHAPSTGLVRCRADQRQLVMTLTSALGITITWLED